MRIQGKDFNITVETKTKAAQLLLEDYKDGHLTRGKMKAVAELLGLSTRSISIIWAATKEKIEKGQSIIFTKTIWSKHKDKMILDLAQLRAIPFRKRSSYRRIAREMCVSKSLVGTWVKEGLIKPHTNAIKPILNHKNKLTRIMFCLSQLDYHRDSNKLVFKSQHNTVHIDEKRFYIAQQSVRYYKDDEEKESHRACKSKRYITKLMFMCAVTRPHYDQEGQCIFDGKIGIFPFIKQDEAKRNSKNRAKGTLENKAIAAVTKEVIQDCLVNQIIPAIKQKWPPNASKNIFVQQDNARPHIKDTDLGFRAAASSDGFNIQLVCQPAMSPDTNINDLGFFRAIQSLQYETASYSMDDLLENVKLAYDTLGDQTLECVFLSLQQCMIEIMKHKGHNDYALPHMGKARLRRAGLLPENLEVDKALVKECLDHLRLPGNQIKTDYEVDTLISQLSWLA